jgi:hypothetical protein
MHILERALKFIKRQFEEAIIASRSSSDVRKYSDTEKCGSEMHEFIESPSLWKTLIRNKYYLDSS